MTVPMEITIDPSDGDEIALFDFGDGEIGLVMLDFAPEKMEIWFDHAGSGDGCNNLVLDAFGRELDLEFCRSREVTESEADEIKAALQKA